MGGDKEGNEFLPPGYTRLEFLESTGTQYILAKNISIDTNDVYSYKSQLLRANRVSGIWATTSDSLRSYVFTEQNLYGISFGAATNYKLSLNDSYQPLKIELNKDEMLVNGMRYTSSASIAYTKTDKVYLFNQFVNNLFWPSDLRFYYFTVKGKHNFVPALDPIGAPCMYDLVSRQSFKNSGTGHFVAGLASIAQLRAILSKLPATGGVLTLSLPAEANTPEVADMLQQCHDTKGWTLTVYEYRPAAAVTYSLRRVREVVWCRRELSEYGSYVDAAGTRWQVERCAAIFGRLGQDPAAYGFEPFDSVEQAAEAWSLTPYQHPEQELNPNQ